MWMVKWLFLALVLAAPAHAQTPDPSVRYHVVDVAADDTLNVREQPGADADVIGAFAPHADDIVITGSVMEVEGSWWWEVAFVDGYLDKGWVNGRFLEPADQQARDSDYPLVCSGTEPFWSLALDEGQATYSSPDQDEQSMSASRWREASGRIGTFAVQLERDGQVGYASVWQNSCSDGMSDIGYPFGTIVILPEGEVLAGCCRRSR
ncbi:MAG TPA: SH3 domain-containing protein [Aestuariivirgaceae bacterium]|nr:SH3 domain-containing protein [Aestuariivirgaceae bacterium]